MTRDKRMNTDERFFPINKNNLCPSAVSSVFHLSRYKHKSMDYFLYICLVYICKKRMNKTISHLFACFLLLAGCNGSLFIEDFLPDIPVEVTVRCGEPTVIRFEHGDWELRSGTRHDFDLVKFTVERTAPTELTVLAGECLYDESYDFELQVGNEYISKSINLRIEPGAKYVVDSVAYDWETFYYYKDRLEQASAVNVNNQGNTPTTWIVYPFQTAVIEEEFVDMTEERAELSAIFGTPPEVPVPDVEGEGKPVLGDRYRPFTYGIQRTSIANDEEVRVRIEAGQMQLVEVWLHIEEYNVPFTLYASNPQSGYKRTISGEYRYKRPYDYLIIPQNAVIK